MEEEIICSVCDTKCTITHEEEDKAEYCPFCGNLLEEADDAYWPDSDSMDQEPYEN